MSYRIKTGRAGHLGEKMSVAMRSRQMNSDVYQYNGYTIYIGKVSAPKKKKKKKKKKTKVKQIFS
jgi:hypothetical protein